jgi:Lar family restriction alleviation protein
MFDLRTKLKPCPFCGNAPNGPNGGDSSWWIECGHCEYSMDEFSLHELIKKWNSRAVGGFVLIPGDQITDLSDTISFNDGMDE